MDEQPADTPPTPRKGFLAEPLTRGEKMFVGALKGGIGGAIVGYGGGTLLDFRDVAWETAVVAGVGAVAGLVVGYLSADTWQWRLGLMALFALVLAAVGGGVWLAQPAVKWAFGWGVQGWATGPAGAVVGGLAGAAVLGGFAFLGGRGSPDAEPHVRRRRASAADEVVLTLDADTGRHRARVTRTPTGTYRVEVERLIQGESWSAIRGICSYTDSLERATELAGEALRAGQADEP